MVTLLTSSSPPSGNASEALCVFFKAVLTRSLGLPLYRSAAIEQRHKSEVHVRLHVAVEETAPRLIGSEVDRHFLETAEHGHVFYDARRRHARNAGDLKAVSV